MCVICACTCVCVYVLACARVCIICPPFTTQAYREQKKLLLFHFRGQRPTTDLPEPPPFAPLDLSKCTPDPILSTLPAPLCHSVARGLVTYTLLLTRDRNWDLVPIACKAVSQLVSLSTHRLPLCSLLSQEHLDSLLAFCCQAVPPNAQTTDNPVGGMEWSQRSVRCLIINLLYHGDVAHHQAAQEEIGFGVQETEGSFSYQVLTEEEEEGGERASVAEERTDVVEEEAVAPPPPGTAPPPSPPPAIAPPPPGTTSPPPGIALTPPGTAPPPLETAPPPLGTAPLPLGTAPPPPGTAPLPPETGEVAVGDSVEAEEDAEPSSLNTAVAGQPGGDEDTTVEGPQSEAKSNEDPLTISGEDGKTDIATDQGNVEAIPPPLSEDSLLNAQSLNSLLESITASKPAPADSKPAPVEPNQDALHLTSPESLPPKAKPLKKLSKHSLTGTKYAPGDYSNIPVYVTKAEPSAAVEAGGDTTPLSYQSFIISNSVDSRLQTSLELPAEISLQCIARTVYKSVLTAVLNCQPLPLDCPLSYGWGEKLKEELVRETQTYDRPSGRSSVAMLCHSIEWLLERAALPQGNIEVVSVLELWNELNSITAEPLTGGNAGGVASPPLGEGSGSSAESDAKQKKQKRLGGGGRDTRSSGLPGLPICTRHALNLLLDILLSPSPSSPSFSASTETWRLGLVLLHTAVRQYKNQELPVDWDKLRSFLEALFTVQSPASIREDVVTSLLLGLVPARVMRQRADGMGREERRGVHLLLEVLVTILERG